MVDTEADSTMRTAITAGKLIAIITAGALLWVAMPMSLDGWFGGLPESVGKDAILMVFATWYVLIPVATIIAIWRMLTKPGKGQARTAVTRGPGGDRMAHHEDSRIEFTVRATTEQISGLTAAIRRAGIDFDPDRDMIAIHREVESVIAGVTSGDELDEAVESLNNLLQINGETRILRTDSENWTTGERYAALRLANEQLSSLGTEAKEPWWLAEHRNWNTVADRWPEAPWAGTDGDGGTTGETA